MTITSQPSRTGEPRPGDERSPPRPLVVLHVLPTMSAGGGAVAALDLATALSNLPSIVVRFCVLGPRPSIEPQQATRLGVCYLGIAEPISSGRGLLRASAALRRRLSDWDVDIAHSHLLPADLVAAFAVSFSKTRHFAHVRDLSAWLISQRIPSRIRRQLHRTAYRCAATHFVAVSHDAGEYNGSALKIAPSRMHVVVDGIDLTRIPDGAPPHHPQDRFRVGCAGRLVREKGHAFVIDAIAQLAGAGHDVELHLAGSGSLENDLRRQALELGIPTRLTISRDVRDMASFYRSLDAFILPSVGTEGLPLVVMEALAAGCPVIATKTTGINDAVRDRQTALLVEPGSSADIADAIARLMQDQGLRSRLAQAGKQHARANHTIERVAEEVRALYEHAA